MHTLVATDANQRVVGTLSVVRQVQTIGRAGDCGLVLPSHGVSRTHATVYLRSDGVLIHDEGSANGVRVNGQLISGPVLIDERSVVQISEYTLQLKPTAEADVAAGEPQADSCIDSPEYDTHLEVASGAGAALARRPLMLVGRGGAYDGARIELDKVLVTVGREESNDVVLEDASVSRRHAQLRLAVTGDRVTVHDLRSANGTYVDGQRVKRADANQDTVIRFGDLAFKLCVAEPQAVRQTRTKSSRRRIAMAVAFAAVAASVVGVAYYSGIIVPGDDGRGASVTTEPDLGPIETEAAAIRRILDQTKVRLQMQDWAGAIGGLNELIEREPWNNEARSLLQQARDELTNSQDLKRARGLIRQGDSGSLQAARRILKTLPPSSTYRKDAVFAMRNIDDRLARRYFEEGQGLCERGEPRRCHASLCRFFDYVSGATESPEEQRARKQMSAIERNKRHRRGLQPCSARRYKNPPTRTTDLGDPEAAMMTLYPSRNLRRAMAHYRKGEVEQAIRLLARLAQRASAGERERIGEMRQRLLLARGKYQEGLAAYRDQRSPEADKLWRTLLRLDSELMPPEVESFYRRDVSKRLGSLYYDLGDEHFRMGRYEKAFQTWGRAKQIDPTNAQIQAGLFQLEKVARRLINEARQLDGRGDPDGARSKLVRAKRIIERDNPLWGVADSLMPR